MSLYRTGASPNTSRPVGSSAPAGFWTSWGYKNILDQTHTYQCVTAVITVRVQQL